MLKNTPISRSLSAWNDNMERILVMAIRTGKCSRFSS